MLLEAYQYQMAAAMHVVETAMVFISLVVISIVGIGVMVTRMIDQSLAVSLDDPARYGEAPTLGSTAWCQELFDRPPLTPAHERKQAS